MTYRKLQLVRTDYLTRLHLYVDTEARQFNYIDVELLDKTKRVFISADPHDTWDRVQKAVYELRGAYDSAPVLPLTVLQPFAVVIALDGARESRKQSVGYAMELAQTHPEHGVRVEALDDAWDLLAFLDGKPPCVHTAEDAVSGLQVT